MATHELYFMHTYISKQPSGQFAEMVITYCFYLLSYVHPPPLRDSLVEGFAGPQSSLGA